LTFFNLVVFILEMFGGDSNDVAWHWFVPLPVEFPPGMKKVVLGFEWDDTFDNVPYQEPGSDGDVETGASSSVGGRIELTTTSSVSSSNKEKSSEHETSDDAGHGEEGSFSATPVSKREIPTKLVKRGRSRDRIGSQDPIQGTLT
jgi:hypothetical protein